MIIALRVVLSGMKDPKLTKLKFTLALFQLSSFGPKQSCTLTHLGFTLKAGISLYQIIDFLLS